MTVLVKNKTGLIVPETIRRRAGFRAGDMLEFKASGGVVTIVPKLPSANHEYTPEQRRIVNAQLAEGLADIRKGRVSRKFDTVDEMLVSLKAGHKALPRQKKSRSR